MMRLNLVPLILSHLVSVMTIISCIDFSWLYISQPSFPCWFYSKYLLKYFVVFLTYLVIVFSETSPCFLVMSRCFSPYMVIEQIWLALNFCHNAIFKLSLVYSFLVLYSTFLLSFVTSSWYLYHTCSPSFNFPTLPVEPGVYFSCPPPPGAA